jgi:hypothetical protein
MPKRVKQKPDPSDELPPRPKGFTTYMQALARKGGQISGARRMTNLSANQRRAIAKKGARARWAKKKSDETS